MVTSPTGAAIRDILITIKRRFPSMEVVVFPVLVQGEFAAQSIANAIRLAHQEQGVDVLIVGRGGAPSKSFGPLTKKWSLQLYESRPFRSSQQ